MGYAVGRRERRKETENGSASAGGEKPNEHVINELVVRVAVVGDAQYKTVCRLPLLQDSANHLCVSKAFPSSCLRSGAGSDEVRDSSTPSGPRSHTPFSALGIILQGIKHPQGLKHPKELRPPPMGHGGALRSALGVTLRVQCFEMEPNPE